MRKYVLELPESLSLISDEEQQRIGDQLAKALDSTAINVITLTPGARLLIFDTDPKVTPDVEVVVAKPST